MSDQVSLSPMGTLKDLISAFAIGFHGLEKYDQFNLLYRKVKAIKLERGLNTFSIFTKVDEDGFVKEVISN